MASEVATECVLHLRFKIVRKSQSSRWTASFIHWR